MKILIIGKFGPEELGNHFFETLINLGYEVKKIEFGPYINKLKSNKSSITRKIKSNLFTIMMFFNKKFRKIALKKIMTKILKEKNVDLIITTYDYLSYIEIQEIKKNMTAKIVMYFPDGLVNINRALFMTAGYDELFFKCKHIVNHLKNEYNLPVNYLPECFNPQKHINISLTEKEKKEYDCDLLFIGSLHSCRVPIIEKLLELNKYKIQIYGSPAPFYIPISEKLKRSYTKKYAANNEKSKLIKAAKININTLHLGEVTGVNVRTFEIAGVGGFQISSYREEINELFEIDKEIVTFKNFSELVEKIDYYLKNSEERKKISDQGYNKAQKEHTYENRIKKIIEITFKNL